ncbi:MAG: hypothetical protein IT585_09720 [candidate division Zixibacteria bacterium]|nr:hypothetical protein [candidate division Zixibacteria bacterium]
MKKSDLRARLKELVSEGVDGMTWPECLSCCRRLLAEFDAEHIDDISNRGKPWSDAEIKIILRLPPTSESIALLARAFKRGAGSIEQIYKWAATEQQRIDEARPDDSFVKQIKRVANEIGWRGF